MTKEEYLQKFNNGVIGICEICHYFNDCAKKGKLKENGCANHSNYDEED